MAHHYEILQDIIQCPNCNGTMLAETRNVKTWNGRIIVEVLWRCRKCGLTRRATYTT